ncbi:unnamed protein product [Adineta steineri]|uniref:LEM domain-containing protein n=1 Tax=Adineta steineri TaxID=433720 RepID=A0A814HEW7_9BILA|nr:unnamed protein product [Adineta steineri]CAF1008815.1 unnamed protein product [Adineta steineri]CAF1018113.1 unnamed protein product [Adineta steineri]
MTLTDQQLRQELISYGEIVPPITNRNREQLRTQLEVLRSQKRTTRTAAASPVRTRSTASPSRSNASINSPSRTRAAASPVRSHASTDSPSRVRATASPSRTRSTVTNTSVTAVTKTRSKQTPKLIELSDSDTETASTTALTSRSASAGKTAPNIQTRSIALRGDNKSPTNGVANTGHATNDVEQSIARHRREIKQLLDSARDRNQAVNTSMSSLRSGQKRESPVHRKSPSPSSKSHNYRHSSKSDDDHDTKVKKSPKSDNDSKANQSPKSDSDHKKKSSPVKHARKPIQSFWKKYVNLIKNLFKMLLVSSVLLGGTIFFLQKGDFIPSEQGISCSVKNATTCEDMTPVIVAVRKQLQVRTGEVECGFRPKSDVIVPRAEIEKNLNEKGLKFNLGNEERWNALIKYIQTKPLHDIVLWTETNHQTNETAHVRKLSTKEAIRSLTCRARQDIHKVSKNTCLLTLLGLTGLIPLAWYLLKPKKSHDEHETTYKDYFKKATNLLQEQYEKHIQDPHAQPWVAINHIRDKIIPEGEQERLKHVWERVKNQIAKQDTRIREELHEIDGKKSDVWRWIKSTVSSPIKSKSPSKDAIEENDNHPASDVGLTECLKLRNCFRSDNYADDNEIDDVIDGIQNRCANIKRIEHIGIHSVYVYLKFSSKEAAAQGYHLLNNWNYHNRAINVKYIRLNRYHEHFPEAKNISTNH